MSFLSRLFGKREPADREPTSADSFPFDAVVEDLMAQRRQAVLPEFMDSLGMSLSRANGGFLGRPDEAWPTFEGRALSPILQIATNELPFIPDALQDLALLNVWVTEEDGHFYSEMGPNGGTWQLRGYRSMEGLVPLEPIDHRAAGPLRGIVWTMSNDYPDLRDLARIVRRDLVSALPRVYVNQIHDQFSPRGETKIGGWPSLVQHPLQTPDYVFQIGSDNEPQWMWGDLGTMYFCRNAKGNWTMEFQCS